MRLRGAVGCLSGAIGVGATALLLLPAGAGAASIEVTTQDDAFGPGDSCSLREAIETSRTAAPFGGCTNVGAFGNDVIELPNGVFTLTRPGAGEDAGATGDLDITTGLSIAGVGDDSTTINAGGLDRVFHGLAAAPVSISDVQIDGGTVGTDGGGILQAGTMTMTLENVTVSDSTSGNDGGGIATYGPVALINSTVAFNDAAGSGGGIYAPGGSVASLFNVTVADNLADADANGFGDGGGFRTAASFSTTNTVIAGNEDRSPLAADQTHDCASGPSYFPRYTLIETFVPGDCLVGFNPGTNIVNTDARLGPLAGNGGSGLTYALLPGSPARDAGTGTGIDLCEPTDERGVPRALGGACDLGALEEVTCGGVRVNVVGSASDDTLSGSSRKDGAIGLGGNDKLSGLGKKDALCGGAGNDKLRGGKGKDKLKGGTGTDKCNGGPGRDRGPGCERKISIP